MAIEKIKNWLKENNLTQIYIPSYDEYLSEYVPRHNNLRYYISKFTGSVAELLVNVEGKSHLFVDGRYTEQAANEVDSDFFEVHTCSSTMSPFTNMLEFIDSNKELAIIPERVSYAGHKTLQAKFKLRTCSSKIAEELVGLNYQPQLNPIEWVSPEKGGVETERKLSLINLSEAEAYFVTALDSIAWLTNGRGYHIPYHSCFLASAIAIKDRCFVFIKDGISKEKSWGNQKSIEWISFSNRDDYTHKLAKVLSDHNINDLKYDPQYLNAADFSFLSRLGLDKLEAKSLLITQYQSIKFSEEIHVIKNDFLKASKAIFNTVNWTKENWKSLSERDVYNETSRFYREQGGHAQSFGTIAGFGANGSIIHYGNPSDQVKLSSGEIFLLDSGGYFESGFATDKTRTFLIGDTPNKKLYVEIYTLVLKGVLGLQYSEFEEGTSGSDLDAITRAPLKAAGYDYAHGTGHGVGLNVHEGGVRISSVSDLPMKAGQVVSLEPGIYLPGVGGVRLENIAHVVKANNSGKLKFDNLVFIGFDHDLIDESMLTEQESKWLDQYEKQCAELGFSFKYNK